MPWNYSSLARKFNSILATYGQNVYLRRRCTECSQTGPYSKYDDNCVICGGTGYHQTIEGFTMRKMIVGTNSSFPVSLERFPTGMIIGEGCYFFCEPNVAPKHGDIIYDFNNGTNNWDKYEINKVLERRYDNRILFYNCASEMLNPSDT